MSVNLIHNQEFISLKEYANTNFIGTKLGLDELFDTMRVCNRLTWSVKYNEQHTDSFWEIDESLKIVDHYQFAMSIRYCLYQIEEDYLPTHFVKQMETIRELAEVVLSLVSLNAGVEDITKTDRYYRCRWGLY